MRFRRPRKPGAIVGFFCRNEGYLAVIDAQCFEIIVEDVFFLSNGLQVIVGEAPGDIGTIAPCYGTLFVDDVEFRQIEVLSERFVFPSARHHTRALETSDLSDCDNRDFQRSSRKLVVRQHI